MLYTVHVGVALHRPPAVHEWRRVRVAASSDAEARLVACQMAACTSVMPVCAEITEVEL